MDCLKCGRLCKQNLTDKIKCNWVTTQWWRKDQSFISDKGKTETRSPY